MLTANRINAAGKVSIILPEVEPVRSGKREMTGKEVPDTLYRAVLGILRRQRNVQLAGYKELCIRRRLAARIRATGLVGEGEYDALLEVDPVEQEALLASISVNVSQFFRNPSVYRALEKRVLPELYGHARSGRSKLRIWSVGCAYGEEAYSVALLCRSLGRREPVSIIATDVSAEALRTARRGLFPGERLTAVPHKMKQEFFTPEQRGFRLRESIRSQVQFFRHDILTDTPFYRAQLILCRNVLIYFSRVRQAQVVEKLADVLPAGGYLVLGRAETLAPGCRHLFHCIDPGERIYRRMAKE